MKKPVTKHQAKHYANQKRKYKEERFMDAFIEKLQNILFPIAEKVNSNKVLKGISAGFSGMLPVVMVGAIFTLLANLNISFYQTLITNLGLKSLFAIPASYTTDMISLYAAFLIGKASAEAIDLDRGDSQAAGIISLMSFLILIPLGVTGATEAGEAVTIASAVNMTFLGSAGLFTAMIIGCVIPRFYKIFITKNIAIKMPDSVPPMISKSFSALLPGLVIAFVVVLVRYAFTFTEAGSMTMYLYTMLRAPLQSMGASPVTVIILLLVCNVLWFFGIHGGMVATAILSVIYTPLTLENLAAYSAGTALPHAIIQPAWYVIGNIGGSGCAMGLVFCLLLFSKSERYKALAKVAVPAGLCGISEPMVFGVPLVLNPIMLIPMLIAPIVTFLLGWAAMISGLVPYMIGVGVNTGTPLLLSAFAAWASWKGITLQAVLIVVSTCIYYPFFRAVDKQACNEEAAYSTEA